MSDDICGRVAQLHPVGCLFFKWADVQYGVPSMRRPANPVAQRSTRNIHPDQATVPSTHVSAQVFTQDASRVLAWFREGGTA